MNRAYPLPGWPLSLVPKKGAATGPGRRPTPSSLDDFRLAGVQRVVDTVQTEKPAGGSGSGIVSRPRPWCLAGYPISAPPRAALIITLGRLPTGLATLIDALRDSLGDRLEREGILCGTAAASDVALDDQAIITTNWTYPGFFDDGFTQHFFGGTNQSGAPDTGTRATIEGDGTAAPSIPTIDAAKWAGREILAIFLTTAEPPPEFMDAAYATDRTPADPAGGNYLVSAVTQTFGAAIAAYEGWLSGLFQGGVFYRSDAKLAIIREPVKVVAPPYASFDPANPAAYTASSNAAIADIRSASEAVLAGLATSMGGVATFIDVAAYDDCSPAAPTIAGWIREFFGIS